MFAAAQKPLWAVRRAIATSAAAAPPQGRRPAPRAALTLTPQALARLREIYGANTDGSILRVGLRQRGCSGLQYSLDFVAPSARQRLDEVVEQDGVTVLIDNRALLSVIGSEMDYRQDRLSSRFVFNNPNVKETCGCGESFLV